MGPSGFDVCIAALFRKIFEVPKPTMNRSGPGRLLHDARVHRDLHRMARERRDDPPADRQPRSVSRAISAETTVDERASIPCLRHHG